MKKGLPLIIILVIIVAALVGWFVWGKGKQAPSGEKTQPEVTQGESFTGKIKDAFLRNVPLKCTYQVDDKNFGSAWLKNKKYYGEVSTNGRVAYVIMVDNCMWTWSKEQPQGIKNCFEPQESEDIWADFEESQQTANVDYRCGPAIVDDSLFNPPAEVKFMDVGQLIQNLGQPTQATEEGEEE
ncbi:hypothetical protein FJZ41_03720 [Candidatus Shapirobacteria bacterium]|nr:hypothetical protein [Candidatus Shapirobacteria bacterium]